MAYAENSAFLDRIRDCVESMEEQHEKLEEIIAKLYRDIDLETEEEARAIECVKKTKQRIRSEFSEYFKQADEKEAVKAWLEEEGEDTDELEAEIEHLRDQGEEVREELDEFTKDSE